MDQTQNIFVYTFIESMDRAQFEIGDWDRKHLSICVTLQLDMCPTMLLNARVSDSAQLFKLNVYIFIWKRK